MAVEVMIFPKKCPECGKVLTLIRKFSGGWWYECTEECDESTGKDVGK